MPTMLVRRGALLAKIEATEGTEAVPDPLQDGVLVENIRVTFTPTITETNEVTPSLDPFDPIVGGMYAQIEFDTYASGSGAAATAPDWGRLMKMCGFAETITAAAIPVIAGGEVFGAAGSNTAGTLGAGAAGVSQLYRGMPIQITQVADVTDTVIQSYGANKVATFFDTLPTAVTITHKYQILANVLYSLASSSISSGTFYVYNDGILYKFVGCRGTVAFNLTSGGPIRAVWRFMGMFLSKTDVALPTVVYQLPRPPIWKNGRLTILRQPAAAQTLTMDIGAQLGTPEIPNQLEAFDPVVITARQPRGTINPKETLTATRDIMNDFRNSTRRPIMGQVGTAAGNRFSFGVTSALYLNMTPADRNAYRVVDVPFHMTGQDSGLYVCCY